MIALEQEKLLEQENEPVNESILDKPRMTACGHLTLLDWQCPSEIEARQATPIRYSDPVQRSSFDRLFEHGLALLLLTTIGAVCACLAHL